MDEVIRQTNIQLQAENRNLQALHTSLHEKYHTNSLKVAELQDSVTAKETEIAELKNQIDDLQYELEKVRNRNDKLETHLAEAVEKLKAYHQLHGDPDNKGKEQKPTPQTSVSQAKLEDLLKEVEEWKELANNRLQELDKLHQTHRETLKEVEKLKMDVSGNFYNVLFLWIFYLILPIHYDFIDPSTARKCHCRNDRIQVPPVAVLRFVQWIDATEDTTWRSQTTAADQQECPLA